MCTHVHLESALARTHACTRMRPHNTRPRNTRPHARPGTTCTGTYAHMLLLTHTCPRARTRPPQATPLLTYVRSANAELKTLLTTQMQRVPVLQPYTDPVLVQLVRDGGDDELRTVLGQRFLQPFTDAVLARAGPCMLVCACVRRGTAARGSWTSACAHCTRPRAHALALTLWPRRPSTHCSGSRCCCCLCCRWR